MHILVVGPLFSGMRAYLTENGYTYTILEDIKQQKSASKKQKNRYFADFSNNESILATINSLKWSFDGVITVYENFVMPTALIAQHLNLPGLPLSAAKKCTDKFLMREAFATSPEKISPNFAVVENQNDLRRFAEKHSFPLILKPANLAKSLLVTKNHNIDELFANYKRAQEVISDIYAKYAPHREPKLIVEEFLEGPIHSVDAFVDSEGIVHVLQEIVDYQTGYDIGFEDNFHYSRLLPSELSHEDQMRLRHVAKLGCEALGMKNSAAHIEIILTRDGPQIVEIGARNGGYRERMHKLANGIDILGAAIGLAVGKKPNITPTKDEPCAVLELFPENTGEFVGLNYQKELEKLPSLAYLAIKRKPGEFAGKAADGHKMCTIIILHNQDKEQFTRDLDFVNTKVKVLTR